MARAKDVLARQQPGQKLLRTVVIRGRRTSIRLERAFWATIDEICGIEAVSLEELCARIPPGRNVTAALRLASVLYLTDGEVNMAAGRREEIDLALVEL